MLLRISLGIAILAGVAALYFSHFQVAPKISGLQSDLATSQQNEQEARTAENKAKTAEKKAKEELLVANQSLAEKTSALDSASARLTQQETRANQLSEQLTRVTGERNEAQQTLAAWNALGVTIDQVRTTRDQLARVMDERDSFTAENKILNRNIKDLQARLGQYEGLREPEVPLPAGLKGSVVAVDPKYDFVVLNIGSNQGVVENGKLLVNRDGKLVARVRITKVEANRSIANIIPEYKQDEIMEGDQVLY